MARKIQMNPRGANAVLNDSAVAQWVSDTTQRIAERANKMHAAKGWVGDVRATDRPHGVVRATDLHTIRSNAKWNTLQKAMWAGRG